MDWGLILEKAIGWLANIIQIATAVFAFVVVFRSRRRLNAMLKHVAPATESERHAAIAIGIRGSILGSVEAHLQAEVMADIAVFEITRSGEISRRQVYDVLREVNQLKQKLTEKGVVHVYLFYKGPVTLAAGIGALLDNWVPVTAHDFRDGKYYPTIVLGKGAVFDIMDAILEEGEEVVIEQTLGN
jgi:hypothetical protein